MELAYIYGRVSTEEQSAHGYSVENQRVVCRAYAQANGYKVENEFFDEGKTGRNTNRDEFQTMLAELESNKVSAIITFKLDRMFRSMKDFSDTIDLLKSKDIKLLSAGEGDITGGVLGGILSVLAQHESETIGNRTRGGMHQKFREGYYPGKAPLGYRNAELNERKIIEPDPVSAPLIKEMFQMYASGQYSQLELCELMYEKGLRGKRSNDLLSPQTLTGIFHNPIYYGWMKWGGLEGAGKHEPLIDKALFDQVQYVLAQNNFFLIRKCKRFYLLRGFVYCPIHEKRHTADHHKVTTIKGRSHISYYRCTNRHGCRASYFETRKLEKLVANQFKKYEFSSEFIELVREQVRTHLQNGRAELRSRKQALTNEKRGIEQKRNNLEDLLVDNSIDRDIFKRQHATMQEQLKSIERQLHELNNIHQMDINVIDEVLAMTRNLHQSYVDAPFNLKRHYLRLFFERIYVQDKKIVKILETPIFKTLREEERLLIRDEWGGIPDSNRRPPLPQSGALTN